MNNSINIDMEVNKINQGVQIMNNQTSIADATFTEISLAINRAKTLAGVLLDDCCIDNNSDERKTNITYMLVELLEGIESKLDKAGESS